MEEQKIELDAEELDALIRYHQRRIQELEGDDIQAESSPKQEIEQNDLAMLSNEVNRLKQREIELHGHNFDLRKEISDLEEQLAQFKSTDSVGELKPEKQDLIWVDALYLYNISGTNEEALERLKHGFIITRRIST